MTRQQKRVAKRRALGLCLHCDTPSVTIRCPKHAFLQNVARRKREKRTEWTEGSRGRPPIHKGENYAESKS